jgi:NitT/TauT family transport system ATP-binding protein
VQLVDYIYKVMTKPEAEHTLPTSRVASTGPPRTKYPMLPHARPGGVTGLLEMLEDRGGREDLYRLAERFVMEIDDILPIVEAATLVGFATVQEGDVAITAEGRAFADADILTRKTLFRDAALKHVALLQQMDSILKSKSDHSMPIEFFHDVLDEHFSEDEVKRQLETALYWGRYAEIFEYDLTTGRLLLHDAAADQAPAQPAVTAP